MNFREFLSEELVDCKMFSGKLSKLKETREYLPTALGLKNCDTLPSSNKLRGDL